MSKSDEALPVTLPDELDRALRRATGRTLSALTSLRKAVLQHVQTARARGASLSEIKSELQEIVSRLQVDARAKGGDTDGEQELAAQVIKWTDGFYKRGD